MITVELVEDGPIIVRGSYEFNYKSEEGKGILDEGKPIALCRCGTSEKKPFCDGSHNKYVTEEKEKGTPTHNRLPGGCAK